MSTQWLGLGSQETQYLGVTESLAALSGILRMDLQKKCYIREKQSTTKKFVDNIHNYFRKDLKTVRANGETSLFFLKNVVIISHYHINNKRLYIFGIQLLLVCFLIWINYASIISLEIDPLEEPKSAKIA